MSDNDYVTPLPKQIGIATVAALGMIAALTAFGVTLFVAVLITALLALVFLPM